MTDDETRKQVEQDANEDLELKDEDADSVAGGVVIQGGAQYNTIKLDSTSPGGNQKI